MEEAKPTSSHCKPKRGKGHDFTSNQLLVHRHDLGHDIRQNEDQKADQSTQPSSFCLDGSVKILDLAWNKSGPAQSSGHSWWLKFPVQDASCHLATLLAQHEVFSTSTTIKNVFIAPLPRIVHQSHAATHARPRNTSGDRLGSPTWPMIPPGSARIQVMDRLVLVFVRHMSPEFADWIV